MVRAFECIVGKRIVGVREEEADDGKALVLELDDGTKLTFGLDGDVGITDWFRFAIVRLNGEKVWRDA